MAAKARITERVGNKPKLPTAAKSPNKVTKNETAFAKKYAKVAQQARQKVDIKGGMSRTEAKAIKDAREQLAKMKQQIAKQGYGSVETTKNKRGGYTSHGIYKELTGKPLPPRKKPSVGGAKTNTNARKAAK